jgi:hypothetical protein
VTKIIWYVGSKVELKGSKYKLIQVSGKVPGMSDNFREIIQYKI